MSSVSKLTPGSPKRFIAFSGIVAVTVSLAFAVPQLRSERDLRQERVATEQLAERGIPFASVETIEARRAQYLRILTDLHEVSQIYGAGTRSQGDLSFAQAMSTAEKVMEMVHNLSDAELTMMIEAVPDLTAFSNATNDLLSLTRTQQASQAGGSGYGFSSSGGTINSGGFPDAPYSTEVGDTRPTTTALLAAAATFEIADNTRELAGRACDEIIVAIGAGFNTALVCLISDGIWVVAKSVFWAIQFESDDVDSAEINGNYLRLGHLHTDIESLQSSLTAHDANIDAALMAHDANIDADLVAHDANIDADLVAHNANIDADLVTHDANIDADLVAHDANIDADLVLHDMTMQALVGGVQQTLDEEIEKRQVHLQAFEVSAPGYFLVSATESGLGVNVSFDLIQTYDKFAMSFANIPNPTITQVETGIYAIQMNIPPFSTQEVFRIRVTHDDAVDHYGELIFVSSLN